MIEADVLLMNLAMNNRCNFYSQVSVKVKSLAQQQFRLTIPPFSSTLKFIDPFNPNYLGLGNRDSPGSPGTGPDMRTRQMSPPPPRSALITAVTQAVTADIQAARYENSADFSSSSSLRPYYTKIACRSRSQR